MLTEKKLIRMAKNINKKKFSKKTLKNTKYICDTYANEDPNIRISVMKVLEILNCRLAKDILYKGLCDTEPRVCEQAILSLSNSNRLDNGQCINDFLIRFMFNESYLTACMLAVQTLGKMTKPFSEKALILALTHENAELVLKASEVLHKIDTPIVTKQIKSSAPKILLANRVRATQTLHYLNIIDLREILLGDEDDYIRMATCNNPDVILLLINLLKLPYSKYELDYPSIIESIKLIRNKTAVPNLIKLLKHKQVQVKIAAALTLGEIGDTSSSLSLLSVNLSSRTQLSKTIINALKKIEGKNIENLLSESLQDKSELIRAGSAYMLGRIKVPKNYSLLVEALNDEKKSVRLNAVESLGIIKKPASIRHLVKILEEPGIEIRCKAIWAIGELDESDNIDILINQLSNSIKEIRVAAAKALKQIGETHWIDFIKGSKKDYIGLGKSGIPNGIDVLIKVSSNEKHPFAETAIKELGESGDSLAVPTLVDILDREHIKHRLTAVNALGNIKDSRAVEPLIQRLSDRIWEICRDSAKALGFQEDVRAIEPLYKTLKYQAKQRTVTSRYKYDADELRASGKEVDDIKNTAIHVRRVAAASIILILKAHPEKMDDINKIDSIKKLMLKRHKDAAIMSQHNKMRSVSTNDCNTKDVHDDFPYYRHEDTGIGMKTKDCEF